MEKTEKKKMFAATLQSFIVCGTYVVRAQAHTSNDKWNNMPNYSTPMSRAHNGNPSWTWISLLCINTIFSIVLAFIFNGPLSTKSLAWPDSIGSWFFFFSSFGIFLFVSFHFISESVCWHKLAFFLFFFCFMRHCDDVSAKAWRWVRCDGMKKKEMKHTLRHPICDVEQKRQRITSNFHFVSFAVRSLWTFRM